MKTRLGLVGLLLACVALVAAPALAARRAHQARRAAAQRASLQPLRDVLALKAGDTVRLRRPIERGVTLSVGDVEAYDASPGRNGNLRAVQVRSSIGQARR